jgi:phosphodiesterase/alkaline phosphatase D-like protein
MLGLDGRTTSDGEARRAARRLPRRRALTLALALALLGTLALGAASASASFGEEPSVLNQGATGVGRTSATLNALVDPNGSNVEECEFEYGTSPSALTQSVPCTSQPGSGENFVIVSAPLAGLHESTTYYFRISATNEFGTAVGSPVKSFATLPTAPSAHAETAGLLTRTSATLYGGVNPNGAQVEECEFQYGTSPTFESGSVPCAVNPGSGESSVQVHALASGLAEDTTYYFRVVAKNVFGTDYSAPAKFTTPPTRPNVDTDAVSELQRESVTLNAHVNPNGGALILCEFEYGTSPALGSHAPCTTLLGALESSEPVLAEVAGLTESTTYYFRIVAGNAFGTAFGRTHKFTTFPSSPKVTTGGAVKVTSNSAQLNANVNPAAANVTKCEFEWGTAQNYGNRTPCATLPGSGESPVGVSATLSGLVERTTYDYRIVATNSHGTSFGGNGKFTTTAGGAPPSIKKLTPKKGSTAGGTVVTLSGAGFTGATAVAFGGVQAASFTVNTDSSITAETPAEPAGTVSVTVTTPVGTSEASSKVTFKFVAPKA